MVRECKKDSVNWLGTVCCVLAVGLAGCGPIISGINISQVAEIELNSARTAGALRHALYEYTAAHQYIQQARDEYGYADYAAARRYANKAAKLAVIAREKSEELSKQPDLRNTP